MGYREMIKKVQHESGFSDAESKDALEMMVESLAEHLTDDERKDFASQLPSELQDKAMSVSPTKEDSRRDILEEFMDRQHIEESRAKKQIMSAWKALKESISDGEIRHIQAQLPNKIVSFLH